MTDREKFEALIKERFGDCVSLAICKNSDGDYLNWDAQVAWFSWQAAIASQQPDGNDRMNYLDKASLLVADWPQWKQEGSDVTKFTNSTEDDGWIEWAGGECPVSIEAIVDLSLRGGIIAKAIYAETWAWGHDGEFDDIIAYRVVKP